MTIRAVVLGILLAVGISIFTYFNDHIIQQTFLIGNHFPVAVFAPLLVLLIVLNPLIKLFKGPLLKPSELALIAALGLVVCGWPGSNFFRSFSALITTPANMVKTEAGWQANHVLSYLPGVSGLLGEGHIQNWENVGKKLIAVSEDSTVTPVRRVWEFLPERTRGTLKQAMAVGRFEQADKADLLNSLDDIIANPQFYNADVFASLPLAAHVRESARSIDSLTEHDRINVQRQCIDAIFVGDILPLAPASNMMLANGDVQNPAFMALMSGSDKKQVGLKDIPWKVWLPTLWFWGGLAILLGLASLCMAIIVQPQWKRELLAFPIARFVQEITVTNAGSGISNVVRSKLFWYGLGAVFAIHIINGTHVWFPNFIQIPLSFDFWPITKLFPVAKTFAFSYMVFVPTIVPTIVGFAFFLSVDVSLSVGLSGILFLVLYSFVNSIGVPFSNEFIAAREGNMLRFGAYLGTAFMMFYVGRHYYLRVFSSSLGFKRSSEVPANAVWATRLLAICGALCVVLLMQAGLDWVLGTTFVLFVFLLFIVMSRINVETGMFFLQPMWVPVGVITVLFGTSAIGPTAYLILVFVSTVFVVDPREAIMPFLTNGLYMTTPTEQKHASTRMALLIGVILVVGFFIALGATLFFQYNHGLNFSDGWVTQYLPKYPFDAASTAISELSAYNEIGKSMTVSGLERFAAIHPNMLYVGWGIAGVVLSVGMTLLRLVFAWWPLHPVCFLVWGTNPGMFFAASFLIGWAIKSAVVKMSGVKGYRGAKPLMLGLIAGDLLAALTWALVGTIYHLATGLVPLSYKVFP